jgi:hypothetical protein
MMDQLWRPVTGAEGFFVSSNGRIKHTERLVVCGKGVRTVREKELKPTLLNTGYFQVMLPGRKKMAVHRLVAAAFCDGYFDGAVVNHKDGNKQNNSSENLEWVTQSENNLHAFRVLGRPPTCVGHFGAKHPTAKAVLRTCLKTGQSKYYGSAIEAVAEGFDSGGISKCCNAIYASHKGYRWSYVQ